MRKQYRWIILLFLCFTLIYFQSDVVLSADNLPITIRRLPRDEKLELANQWVKTNKQSTEEFAKNILNSMDPKAYLLVLEDIPTLSLWSLKIQNNIPSGIIIYDFDGTFFEPLPLKDNRTLHDYLASDTNQSVDDIFQVRQSSEKDIILKSTLPVYCTARRDISDLPGYQLIPAGMVYLFWKKGMEKPDYRSIVKKIKPLDDLLQSVPTKDTRNMIAITRFMRGMNYMQIGKTWSNASALAEFRKSMEYANDLRGIHSMLSENFLILNDMENAYHSAENAIQRKPDSPKSYYVMGDYYSSKKYYREAIENYHKGINLDPSNGNAKYKLGTFYRLLDQPDSALQWFTEALKNNPNDKNSHLQMAEIYEKRGNTSLAIEHYKKYLSLETERKDSVRIKKKLRKIQMIDK